MVKVGNRAVTEVLVKWQGSTEEDATWECYQSLCQRFPNINLDDKVVAREGE